jgi:hypothetical protein
MNIPSASLIFLFGWVAALSSYAKVPYYSFYQEATLTCNDQVQISLDANCQALIVPDEILEGYVGDYKDIALTITDPNGFVVSNPVSGAYAGKNLTVKATHVLNGNSCWGMALIEDKLPPKITCKNTTFQIQCFQSPDHFPLPTAVDNCDPTPKIVVTNEIVDGDNLCAGITIIRTFSAIDQQNNASPGCVQMYQTVQPALPDFPEDIDWTCEKFAAYPSIIKPTPLTTKLSTTGSGVPDVAVGTYCPYNVSQHTDTLSGCGSTFTLVRTWTVLNWCTGQIIQKDIHGDDNIQVIKVMDLTPPVVVKSAFTVVANKAGNHPNGCTSVDFLPPAMVTDSCHATTQRIFTPVGEAVYANKQNGNAGGFIPEPGLPLGEHIITYLASDVCGNTDSVKVKVTVEDQIQPTAVCDEHTKVALGTDGRAEVFAATFDDGSHDNCCIDTFLVRRMSSTCNDKDKDFDGSVHFCCADIGKPVTVVFRVIDCSGNFNDCMVTAEVEDKVLPALLECPPAKTVSCEYYAENLEIPLSKGNYGVLKQFGNAVFTDNCAIAYLDTSVVVNIDQCLQGTITRNWKVTDLGQSGVVACTQKITVNHISDWVVRFPKDLTVTCTESLPPTGEPEIFFDNCELIGKSFEDELFTVVPDACYKIARTWIVINWCAVGAEVDQEVVESSEAALKTDLDGDGTKNNPRVFQDGLNTSNYVANAALHGAKPDGYIVYQQIIKVNDVTKPVISCDPVIEICILEPDCDVTFSLPQPKAEDCSKELTYTATGALGTGLGPFVNVTLGNYPMTYKVSDNCGNSAFCETLVKVKDCKNPTPFCINGLSVTLGQDTSVTIKAENFDAGSFDNCSGTLKFSFSPDVSDSTLVFDCFSIGYVIVQVWTTDGSFNQDYCETFVFVTDNIGVCQGPPLVSGTLSTENNRPVKGSMVGLNGASVNEFMTGEDGGYSFEMVKGGDYSVSCAKDTFPLNGVTTYDLVLISKHILGTQLLDSPYKMIAADANRSNSITTADLVAIRKLILQIEDRFPGNQSWRFIKKDFAFPNPANPFVTPFPEALNFNNVKSEILNANFIGIKVGDVNLSANSQF